jgi:hypothetical protein
MGAKMALKKVFSGSKNKGEPPFRRRGRPAARANAAAQ